MDPRRDVSVVVVAAVVGMATAADPVRVPRYTVTGLGSLDLPSNPSGTWGEAWAVNELGWAAGWSRAEVDGAIEEHAVFWGPDGVVDLGTLGGTISYAKAVNNDGHVVGVSKTVEVDAHGFAVWEPFLWAVSKPVS